MATMWTRKMGDDGELRTYDSATLIEMLADGRMKPTEKVVKTTDQYGGDDKWIDAKDAVPMINRERRDGESLRLGVLWFLAAVSLLAGLIMLLYPSMGEANPFGGGELINYHKLAMGVTFTLCGAVFASAALAFRRGP